jgi:hypothetical protein
MHATIDVSRLAAWRRTEFIPFYDDLTREGMNSGPMHVEDWFGTGVRFLRAFSGRMMFHEKNHGWIDPGRRVTRAI